MVWSIQFCYIFQSMPVFIIHTNPRTNNSCMSRYAYKQVIDRCENKLFNWLVGIFYRINDRKKKCVAISEISSTYTVELLKLSGANFNELRKFYRFVGSHLVYSFIILFPKGNILYNPNSWMGGTQELHVNWDTTSNALRCCTF